MRKRGPFVIVVVLIIVAGWWLTIRDDGPPDDPVPSGNVGFVATVDSAAELPAAAAPGEGVFSTSHEGLVSRPSPTPGGGVYLDLQGRFQNAVTATVNDSGEVEIECLPDSVVKGGER